MPLPSHSHHFDHILNTGILLNGTMHHCSLGPFHLTAGTTVIASAPLFCERGVHAFQFNILPLILCFCSPHLKKMLEIVSFSSQTCSMSKTFFIVHQSSGDETGKHYIMNVFFQIVLKNYCFTLYHLNCTGLNLANKEATVPCLLFCHKT
jgi:hypothetical protein